MARPVRYIEPNPEAIREFKDKISLQDDAGLLPSRLEQIYTQQERLALRAQNSTEEKFDVMRLILKKFNAALTLMEEEEENINVINSAKNLAKLAKDKLVDLFIRGNLEEDLEDIIGDGSSFMALAFGDEADNFDYDNFAIRAVREEMVIDKGRLERVYLPKVAAMAREMKEEQINNNQFR